MPNIKLYQRSFAGGEISPEMFGRIDDVKYQTGAALLRNMIATPQGPVENRPGFQFVRETRTSSRKSRLIPFTYSTDQTLVIELGVNTQNTAGYMRFHTQGGTLLAPTAAPDNEPYLLTRTVTFNTSSNTVDGSLLRHAAGRKVFFTSTGTLPAGVVAGRVYQVRSGSIPSSSSISLAELATPTTAMTFATTGTGTHTMHTFVAQGGSALGVNLTHDGTTIDWSNSFMLLENGMRVFLTNITPNGGGTAAAQTNTIYYVVNAGHLGFQLSTTAGGTAIVITTGGSPAGGTCSISRYFARTDIANGVLTTAAGNVGTEDGTPVAGTYYFRDVAFATHSHPAVSIGASPEPISSTFWFPQGANGEYQIPTQEAASATPYTEALLFDVHYVQSNDVLTLVHPQCQPMELKRLGATRWTMTPVALGTSLNKPASVTATPTLGSYSAISTYTNAANVVADFTTVGTHNLLAGDPVYITGMGVGGDRLKVGTGGTPFASGFFVVATVPTTTTFTLKDYATGTLVRTNIASGTAPAYNSGDGKVTYWARISDTNQYYKVTAINDKLEESPPNDVEASCENNLLVSGAYNTISWPAVSGAVRYNVYKKQSGLFGFIGQAVGTSFVDDNIAPDMGITPPIYDNTLEGTGNYPAAVTYYEQRRCFGGTTSNPQGVWMTRSATESDLSYSIPTQDTDRISFRIAAREANTIRHMVPLQQLVLLTNSAEWRVTSVNNDALTPFSLSVRPQSYIGANNVQPSIINTSLVYCAARGGHVREMGYSWQSNGYITGDLSLRAAHLFDGYTLSDMTYAKAPKPLLWFVSSTGKLLGLTYIPEEQVGAWHQHDTDGAFESCAAIPEGDEDSLYVIVRRTIGGNTKRYVERMSTRNFATLEASFFVDSGRTFNGTNTDPAKEVTLSGGSQWVANELVTITASAPGIFTGSTDIGDAIVIIGADGTKYRVLITQYVSATVAQGVLDKALPATLRNVATSSYAFARDTVSGLSHLEGKAVSILADGVVITGKTVTGGVVSLGAPYTIVHVGLPYEADLQTVPATFQAEAFGKGVFKNINKVVLGMFQSSTFYVGPNASLLVKSDPYAASAGFDTGEVDVTIQPRWNWTGQTFVRQRDPLPLTITSICYEAVIGGS